MTSIDSERLDVDSEAFRSLCAEARDLAKRLEGSSVQRVVVSAGDAKIVIERAFGTAGAAPPPGADGAPAALPGGALAFGAFGPGVAPEARGASGAFTAIGSSPDNRIAVLAPLVGTFYRSASPGAKPFVEGGSAVSVGDTVCIVEAMKLMNEVAANEAGTVAEILVQDGERVEFEQVLMYLEPADD